MAASYRCDTADAMSPSTPPVSDAFRILPGSGPVVITCEHASERLPPPYVWPDADARVRGTHWASDLGAAALVEALHERTGWPAVLSRFCRLIVDPNRPEHHPDLFRTHADGEPIALNQDLSPTERQARILRFHRPYHHAVQQTVAANPGAAILSIHSFTDLYEGQRRHLEVGVLFDLDEAPALAMHRDFVEAGLLAELNAPWSGKEGLVYAPHRHAQEQGRVCIELELRQDKLADPDWLATAADAIAASAARRLG